MYNVMITQNFMDNCFELNIKQQSTKLGIIRYLGNFHIIIKEDICILFLNSFKIVVYSIEF